MRGPTCSWPLGTRWAPSCLPITPDPADFLLLAESVWNLHLGWGLLSSGQPGPRDTSWLSSACWEDSQLVHFLMIQIVALRFLYIWAWCIHISAILYRPCWSGSRLTGSESKGTFSFTRKTNYAFQCTFSGVYFHSQYTWIPFIGNSDNICWDLKIVFKALALVSP